MEAVSENDEVHSLAPAKLGGRRMSTLSNLSSGRRPSVMSTESAGNNPGNAQPPGKPQRKMSLLRKYSLSFLVTRRFSSMLDRKSSTSNIDENPKNKMKYENTYRMTPESGDTFQSSKVKMIIDEVLKDMLHDVKYDVRACGKLSCLLSNEIKSRVKKLNFKRYRIIAHVVLGEKKGQGIEYASRCIWDSNVDSYACSTYSNDSLCAICSVHGIYLE